MSEQAEPRRGEVQRDRDGSEWRVLHVRYESGRRTVHRVRVGSLAERTIFGASAEPRPGRGGGGGVA